jgi:hypothetical protein
MIRLESLVRQQSIKRLQENDDNISAVKKKVSLVGDPLEMSFKTPFDDLK